MLLVNHILLIQCARVWTDTQNRRKLKKRRSGLSELCIFLYVNYEIENSTHRCQMQNVDNSHYCGAPEPRKISRWGEEHGRNDERGTGRIPVRQDRESGFSAGRIGRQCPMTTMQRRTRDEPPDFPRVRTFGPPALPTRLFWDYY